MIKDMKTTVLAGVALLALLAGGGAASAATCTAGCNEQHTQCTKSGKDYGACMDGWRQCKTTCLTPAKTTPAPAPRPTPAVVRR